VYVFSLNRQVELLLSSLVGASNECQQPIYRII
jgi:hypothetical protein